ncbi:MAG: single-stranded DNA-binding protein [Flavobacteriaceae bacterium]|jgi:single-strand DNA-binding protein|nr:single-stranded DNA-binding protein [Flavobacteriaceae bacterium]
MNGTLNKVILIGNVGDDIKVHQFDENNKIGRLPLATSESYTSRETGERVTQTEWHNLVVRNKLVDIFEKYVKKGDKLYVEGKLKTRKWQDQNGQDRYTTEITVNEFTFLTPKSSSDQASSTSESNYDSGQSSSSPAVSDTEDEDALPF